MEGSFFERPSFYPNRKFRRHALMVASRRGTETALYLRYFFFFLHFGPGMSCLQSFCQLSSPFHNSKTLANIVSKHIIESHELCHVFMIWFICLHFFVDCLTVYKCRQIYHFPWIHSAFCSQDMQITLHAAGLCPSGGVCFPRGGEETCPPQRYTLED